MQLYRKGKTSSPIALCEQHGKEAVGNGWIDMNASTGMHCHICRYKKASTDREKMLLAVSKMKTTSAIVSEFINQSSKEFFTLLTDKEKAKVMRLMQKNGLQEKLVDMLCGAFFSGMKEPLDAATLSYYIVFTIFGEKHKEDK